MITLNAYAKMETLNSEPVIAYARVKNPEPVNTYARLETLNPEP